MLAAMKLPPNLSAGRRLEPGLVVCHKNALGVESFGVIVSEVAGTYQVAYPSRLHRKVRVVPLEEFAALEEIGVPQAPELQPADLRLTARRALALKDQPLSLLGSNTAEFLALCLHGGKEMHHVDKLKITLGRAVLTVGIFSIVQDVGKAIGNSIRRSRRRR
jgi:hypothetical protein